MVVGEVQHVIAAGISAVRKPITSACSRLQVTIWNTGQEGDTFEPEQYGETITIVKTMNARGATSTKVLNARGEKMMSKASDVARMLNVLAVNAANPSIVLTQDHARGLLSGDKVNRKLYDLMMESLGFDTTYGLLDEAKMLIAQQQNMVRTNLPARGLPWHGHASAGRCKYPRSFTKRSCCSFSEFFNVAYSASVLQHCLHGCHMWRKRCCWSGSGTCDCACRLTH